MNTFTDIEEVIADAKAEEEVAKEQQETADDTSFRDELREHLRDAFRESKANGNKVNVDIDDYVILKLRSADLDRLLSAIMDELTLSYNKEYLRVGSGDRIADTFRVLYPEAYDHILAFELAHAEGE